MNIHKQKCISFCLSDRYTFIYLSGRLICISRFMICIYFHVYVCPYMWIFIGSNDFAFEFVRWSCASISILRKVFRKASNLSVSLALWLSTILLVSINKVCLYFYISLPHSKNIKKKEKSWLPYALPHGSLHPSPSPSPFISRRWPIPGTIGRLLHQLPRFKSQLGVPSEAIFPFLPLAHRPVPLFHPPFLSSPSLPSPPLISTSPLTLFSPRAVILRVNTSKRPLRAREGRPEDGVAKTTWSACFSLSMLAIIIHIMLTVTSYAPLFTLLVSLSALLFTLLVSLSALVFTLLVSLFALLLTLHASLHGTRCWEHLDACTIHTERCINPKSSQ